MAMCWRQSTWLIFCHAALLLDRKGCASGNLAARGRLTSSPETAVDDKIFGGGISRHPKSPKPLGWADVPLGSTPVRLALEGGAWDVMFEDDASDKQVRALLDHICAEAEERDPGKTAAILAGRLAAFKHGYERTVWWFEGMRALDVFDEYLAEMIASAADRPVRVLEIGSYEGGSAVWFAKNLLLHTDSVLICIDSWEGSPELKNIGIDMPAAEGNFRRNIARAPNGERVTVVKGESMLALAALVRDGATSTFDVIYVDGDHAMSNAITDGILAFRLLKVGGLMIFDDMLFYPSVARATAAIVEALGGEGRLEVLYSQQQLVVNKTADDRWATSTSAVTTSERDSLASVFAPSMPSRAYSLGATSDDHKGSM